jgi:SAM-dependent methyltransferase
MVALRPSNEVTFPPDCGALRTGGEQIMADSQLFQSHRFRSAAAHYLSGRPAYAPRLIRLVAQLTRLSDTSRVLDLGCGPGMLAGAFAPFVAEVVAIDPEPEMLRIAEDQFGGMGNISFVRGSSFDLSSSLGQFRLVTMGRSFHWMDRAATLRILDQIIEPDGAVALFDSTHSDGVPENAWAVEYSALLRRYAKEGKDHPHRRGGTWVRHEALLLDSAFSILDQISVIERRPVTTDQLVHRAFSRSSTAPDRLGPAAPGLAAEIEEVLRPFAEGGVLNEVVATSALVAHRPGAEP